MGFLLLLILVSPILAIVFGVMAAGSKKDKGKIIDKLTQLKGYGRIDENDFNFVVNPKYSKYAGSINPATKQIIPQQTAYQQVPANQNHNSGPATYYNVAAAPSPTQRQEYAQPVSPVQPEVPKVQQETSARTETPKPNDAQKVPTYSFSENQKPVQPVVQLENKKHGVSTINVVLIVGTIFIILSGLIFATTTWQVIGNGVRSIIIIALTAMFYAASAVSEKKFNLDRTGMAFFTLGSIFMPITLIAVGFFRLFGDWFSFYGDGKYLLLGLTFAILCGSTAAGALKYRVQLLSLGSLLSMSAAVCCLIVSATGWNDKFTISISVYSLIVMLAGKILKNNKIERLEIITGSWNTFSVCNLFLFSFFGLIFSGNGIVGCISVILFSILFLDKDFNSEEKGYGAFVFVFLFAVGLYKAIVPNNAGDFLYISAALSTVLFALGFMNFYPEKIKKVCSIICVCVVSLSMLLGLISAGTDSWTLGTLVAVAVLIANSLYCIIAKKQKKMGLLFAMLSVLFFSGAGTLLSGDKYFGMVSASVLTLLLFAVLYILKKNTVRSGYTDVVFGLSSAYIGIRLIVENGFIGIVSNVMPIISVTAATIILGLCALEKKKGTFGIICRWAFPIYFFFAAIPLTDILEYTSLSTEWASFICYAIVFSAAVVSFALRKKVNTFSSLNIPLKAVSLTAGLFGGLICAILNSGCFSLAYSLSSFLIMIIYSAFSKSEAERNTFAVISSLSSIVVLMSVTTFFDEFSHSLIIWYTPVFALWLGLYIFGRKSERISALAHSFATLVAFFGFIGTVLEYYPVAFAAMTFAVAALIAFADGNRMVRAVAQYAAPLTSAVLVLRLLTLIDGIEHNFSLVIWFAAFAVFSAVCILLQKKSKILSEYKTPILLYTLFFLLTSVVFTTTGVFSGDGEWSVFTVGIWLGAAVMTLFFAGEENKAKYLYISATAYSFAVFATAGLIFREGMAVVAMYITFAVLCTAAFIVLAKGNVYMRKEFLKFFGVALEITSIVSMIIVLVDAPENPIPAVAAVVTAALTYVYAMLRRNNLFSAPSILVSVILMMFIGDYYFNLEYVHLLLIFAIFSVAGRIVHKSFRCVNESENTIDWLTIAAVISSVVLMFTSYPVWRFVGALCTAGYPLLYYKKISDSDICNHIILTITGALSCIAWWMKPFDVADIIILEFNYIPLYIYCFALWKIWKNQRGKIETAGFILAIIGIVHMTMDIFAMGYLADSLILLSGVVIMLVVSFIIKKRRWFILSVTMLLLITLFMTKDFWQSLAWWVYLLVVGVLLIVIAAVNELGKQKSADGENSAKDKIRRFMDEWTW